MHGMALLYRATIHPSKLELLAAWLPGRPWYHGQPGADVRSLATYRFDDPAGAVGIETFLVAACDGVTYQVPLTYRGAPLDGGDRWLVGTADHSVLGRRWIYDGCADPVYGAALARAILAGAPQAEEFFDNAGRAERRAPTMTIASDVAAPVEVPAVEAVRRLVDDDPTLIVSDRVDLAVVRRPDAGTRPPGVALTGTWPGQPTPLTLASAASR